MSHQRERHDISAALRGDITRFAFRPGELLTEERLSARYGVSRTPIREALRALEAEGLIEVDGARRVVRSLNVAEIEDIYRVRAALERLAVAQACERATDEAIAVHAATWDSGDDSYFEADVRFHRGIARLAENSFLLTSLERVDDRIAIVRLVDFSTKERIEVARSEHKAILESIARRDVSSAERLMQAHIEGAIGNVRELITAALARIYLDAPGDR